MKAQTKRSVVILLAAGIISSPLMAATNASLQSSVAHLEKEVAALKRQIKAEPALIKKEVDKQVDADLDDDRRLLPVDLDLPGRALVSTGPYLGINVALKGLI
jgi:hypothetical protein